MFVENRESLQRSFKVWGMGSKRLNRNFWGRHIWACGYFVASSGNVADEVIIKYIEEQGKESPDGDFKIDD